MAAAVSLSTPLRSLESTTVNVTGAAATTTYVLQISWPAGGVTTKEVTTDGSGAASFVIVPPDGAGTVGIEVRPAAESKGTTTAAATISGSQKKR